MKYIILVLVSVSMCFSAGAREPNDNKFSKHVSLLLDPYKNNPNYNVLIKSLLRGEPFPVYDDWAKSYNRPGISINRKYNGCSTGNSLFEIRNPSDEVTMHVKVCISKLIRGVSYSREFRDLTLLPKQKEILGCRVEGGNSYNKYKIHWKYSDGRPHPEDITNPREVLMLSSQLVHPGHPRYGHLRRYYLENWHDFRTITVTYTNSGRKDTIRIKPQDFMLALGRANTVPPTINNIRYTEGKYTNSCL